jgi:hypothetical protein
MSRLIKKLLGTALGVAVMLGYWTFVGDSGSQSESMNRVPEKVWEGGAGTMQIEAESTGPAQMRVSFDERSESDDSKSMETYEDVSAGFHTWTVDLPANAGGYVEFGAAKPKVGDKLSMKVLVNGKLAYEESSTLDEPLKPNYAFFVQAHFDEYSKATLDNE